VIKKEVDVKKESLNQLEVPGHLKKMIKMPAWDIKVW